MGLKQVELTTCYGERKLADKLALFLETDKQGTPFYKIEGSCGGTIRFVVDFATNREMAQARFLELSNELLLGQITQMESE